MTDDKKRLYDLIDDYRTAMMVTRTESDGVRARPMYIARVDDDGIIWFLTSVESDLEDEVRARPKCALTMQDSSTFLSLSGTGVAHRDQDEIDTLWSDEFEAWFEKKDAVVIEFQPRKAEYWKEGLKGLEFLIEAARAIITRQHIRPEKVGDHARVDLP